MWRIRLGRELPRYLLSVAATCGLLASARLLVAPPHPRIPAPARTPGPADRAAEGYAVLFARRYLTWEASHPQSVEQSLQAFTGPGMEAGAGEVIPATGEQHVEWAEVVQAREAGAGREVYTVAADTDTAGLLYLTVSVGHGAGGSLLLEGYPAFVGAPSSAAAPQPASLPEVSEPALATVVTRALRNYLAGSVGELAADLTADARVSLPPLALTLESVQHLGWVEGARTVAAVVQAHDERGVQYLLDYELDVARQQGRWEVAAIQTDPDS
ncbi:MAG TPA: conjugal transfer protein [Solirubrobacteraceae bacterium]|nr:conjugal transfer protein [Solirubrobacteraceae bacterium]